MYARWLTVIVCVLGCGPTPSAPPRPEVRWLRGQLHAHSARSGDSETNPSEVADWYAAHGFDFLVFTDHDYVTTLAPRDDILVIPGVELTQNDRDCDPSPEPGELCLLHVNALFVDPLRAGVVHVPPSDRSRRGRFRAAIRRAHALGGLAQINHPNFHHALDAPLLAELGGPGGADLFELANEAVDSGNRGDARHPSVESLWDAALTQRGSAGAFATATDDAHHYADADRARAGGAIAHVGNRGWVSVRVPAGPVGPAAIRRALEDGDFYASNGLVLAEVKRRDGTLHVRVDRAATIRFVGPDGVLSIVEGTRASCRVNQGYVRAVVEDDEGRRAWNQPSFAR
ncbi:MAG: PHP domain-containing protein [Sandaracinaceae bacterium]